MSICKSSRKFQRDSEFFYPEVVVIMLSIDKDLSLKAKVIKKTEVELTFDAMKDLYMIILFI